MTEPGDRLTQMLNSTDPQSAEALLPLVYDELRQLARARMHREKPGQTLQPTALVHEAFMRIIGNDAARAADATWENRRHFFAAAAESMRRILINQARRKARIRHGGDVGQVPLDDLEVPVAAPTGDVLAVDAALEDLEAMDPRAREIVNLRYFVGLTITETAAALGVSESTVEREWRFLRTFLQESLSDSR